MNTTGVVQPNECFDNKLWSTKEFTVPENDGTMIKFEQYSM